MDQLSLADLFLVGLVLDISGAVLLAKGLLLRARSIAALNTYWGINEGAHEDRCRNRVAGAFGIAYLVSGFVLQAAGYGLQISGVPTTTGTSRLLAALGRAAVVSVFAWVAWAFLKEPMQRLLEERVEREREAASAEIRRKKSADEQS